jgi:ubiquitin-conjugating enzyme E2 Q
MNPQDGWNPINDIESVIVSIRSLLVVGDGRLKAAYSLPEATYKARLEAASTRDAEPWSWEQQKRTVHSQGGSYSVEEAQSAYSGLSNFHEKNGWNSEWWARKG